MRLGVCSNPKTADTLLVIEIGGRVYDLAAAMPELRDAPINGVELVRSVIPMLMERLVESPTAASTRKAVESNAPLELIDEMEWRPPVDDPGKILCVGLNYADHARETGKTPPPEPLVFSKLNTTLRGHHSQIVIPKATDQVDFEAELVVVIGKAGRDIRRENALSHVAGYMCGHDVSARDWQKGKPGGQWLLGKSFDSFAPTGPWLVTSDEIDPGNLGIRLRLNDVTMQDSNTNQLLFPVDVLIAYISQVCTLEPGDLLFTGTPAGVGVARDPQVFLQAGDVVEVEIDGLGVLRNHVVNA